MITKIKIAISKFFNHLGLFVSKDTTLPKSNLKSFLTKLKRTGYQPELVLDIGANKSSWSLEVASFFPDTQFFLVEPQHELKNYLESFCTRFTGSNYLLKGVGAKVGFKIFTVFKDTVSSSFYTPQDKIKRLNLEQRDVEITTIDQIVKVDLNGKVPDLVKIDAEGGEYDILLGAKSVLGISELIFLELNLIENNDEKDFVGMINIMKSYGYVPLDFTWFYSNQVDGFPVLAEVAFALNKGKIRNNLHQIHGNAKSK
jgi:FkbM family methyltransferase